MDVIFLSTVLVFNLTRYITNNLNVLCQLYVFIVVRVGKYLFYQSLKLKTILFAVYNYIMFF